MIWPPGSPFNADSPPVESQENPKLTFPTELYGAQFFTQTLVIIDFMWIFSLQFMGGLFILIRSLRKELRLI